MVYLYQSFLIYSSADGKKKKKTIWKQKIKTESNSLENWQYPSKLWAFLLARIVKNLPAMQDTQVRSLG